MTSVLKKCLLGTAAVSMLAVTASPADAQYRRYRHHDSDAGVAIGAGIIGLGIGAAIASSNRGYYGNSYGYYGNGYGYDPYYGRGYSSYGYAYPSYYGSGYGYDRGYYGRGYHDGYRRHCRTVREYDPYRDRWVRVRYC
jgi:hypothetical protein